jgi:hypothetical protein
MERGRVRGTETDSKKQKERDGQRGDTEQRRDGGRIESERETEGETEERQMARPREEKGQKERYR